MNCDQRAVERDACFIEACLSLGAKLDTVDCLVVDISEDGARIEIDPEIALPSTFRVLLPVVDGVTIDRFVTLRWRIANMAGVQFVGTANACGPRPEIA